MDVPAGTLVITAALGIPEIPAKSHERTEATGGNKEELQSPGNTFNTFCSLKCSTQVLQQTNEPGFTSSQLYSAFHQMLN